MLTLQLPQEIEDRLDLLTLRTGHSRQFYVLEALLEHIDELEAQQLALERLLDARTQTKSETASHGNEDT